MTSDASGRQWTGGALLGLDIGSRRVGVAVARSGVRIAHPLTTVPADESVYEVIAGLAREHGAEAIIAGWPRGLAGQRTAQTESAEQFVFRLRERTGLLVVLQDEALTSQKAEAELQARRKPFAKADVDALAATYILEDYMNEHELEARI